jgi:hypothetical protein
MSVPPKLQAKDLGDLKQQEIDLIYLIRNVYRFGEITILTRDGTPQDVTKTVLRVRLGDLSTGYVDTLKDSLYNTK